MYIRSRDLTLLTSSLAFKLVWTYLLSLLDHAASTW